MKQIKQFLIVICGVFLIATLGCQSAPVKTGYVVKIDNFSPEAQEVIENSLMSMQGYRDHRVSVATHRYVEYWYDTVAGSAQVQRELNKTIHQHKLNGLVQFSGNTFLIKSYGGR